MKFLNIIPIIFCTAFLAANSIFSFDGLPVQYYGNDVYGLGMGESGTGDLFRINTDYLNPSVASTSNQVTFSTAVSLGYIRYKDKDSSYRADGIYFPYFTANVPIGRHKFAFSFNSFSSGNLENELEREWEEYEFKEINRINSSLYKMDLIYALKNDYLNIGIAMNYYIGHRTRYWEADFADTEISDSKYELEKNFKNPGYSIGVSKKTGNISFGLAYNSNVDLGGDIIFKYAHPPYSDNVVKNEEYGFNLPARYSGGITCRLKGRLKTSLDLYYEIWKELEEYDKNTLKIAAGIAYDPLSGYGKWYERIPLRMGGYYRELPFEVNEEKIIEKAVSFGLSIPLKSSNKKIDLAVSYISRGDLNKHDIEDDSLFFSVGVIGLDIFSKRVKRTEHRDIPKPD
jgi:hypothetical protein